MVQKALARLCIILLAMAGMFLLTSIFILPYYAEAISDMTGGQTALPKSLQVAFNFSAFAIHHKLAIAIVYGIVFIVVAAWSIKTRKS
jgi:type II secretory pathway component PulF